MGLITELILIYAVLTISFAQNECPMREAFDPECPENAQLIEMTEELEDAIVHKHNELREFIANGHERGHVRAADMVEVVWDDSLAQSATVHAYGCKVDHDGCQSSEQFPLAGQSVYVSYGETIDTSPEGIMVAFESAIREWYSNIKYSKGVYLRKFPVDELATKIGYFTQIVNAKSSRIGCSGFFVPMSAITLTCNYAKGNVVGDQIYIRTNEPGSKCIQRSLNYAGLCDNSDVTRFDV